MKARDIISFILLVCILNTGAIYSGQIQDNQGQDKAVIKRFAMAVGANNGGKDRVLLHYAVSDAQAILNVFEELGGVEEDDILLLEEPDVRTFYTEMGKLQSQIEKSKADYGRVEFIFYYSGHSDENYILLGDEKISYKNLRDTINGINADVRIAILDSCASGAFTRIKGGKKRLPFLMDSAYDMRGFAVMTSSSANEASQESDLIQSSFFTHYLISGMRGAADMSQDGRVTMNEAYQFAFNETLAQTTKTISGPQHPYTDIQMSGTGDVVMTDVQYTTPRGRRAEQIDKHTVLQGKSTYRIFGEFSSKSTEIYGEYALLMGGSLGVTINHFSPTKKLHFRATALAGSGTSRYGSIFYIFEPGVEGVLNISRVVRLTFGLSVPLTDKDDTGMNNVSLNVGFQFGK